MGQGETEQPAWPGAAEQREAVAPEHAPVDDRGAAAGARRCGDAPESVARARVERYFSWASIAQRTLEFYRELTTA